MNGATKCNRGYFKSSISGPCLLCPRWHYCPDAGTIIPTPCPSGFSCDSEGIFDPLTHICPRGLICLNNTQTTVSINSFELPIDRRNIYIAEGFSIYLKYVQENLHTFTSPVILMGDRGLIIGPDPEIPSDFTNPFCKDNVISMHSELYVVPPTAIYFPQNTSLEAWFSIDAYNSVIDSNFVEGEAQLNSTSMPNGTYIMGNINPAGGSYPVYFNILDGQMFFSADNGTNRGLYAVDITSWNYTLIDSFDSPFYFNYSDLQNSLLIRKHVISYISTVYGMIYFSAFTLQYGFEIYSLNPFTHEVSILRDIYIGENSSFPEYFFVAKGFLYFTAQSEFLDPNGLSIISWYSFSASLLHVIPPPLRYW